MFMHFQVEFERRFNAKIQVLRTDGGTEYNNLNKYCATLGIRRQISEPRNQASNGKAERMHRTLLNMARSMVFTANLEFQFWGDVLIYRTQVTSRDAKRQDARLVESGYLRIKMYSTREFGKELVTARQARKDSRYRRRNLGISSIRPRRPSGSGITACPEHYDPQ